MLKDLAKMIGVKKTDSARLWCIKKDVRIYGKNSQRYVLAIDVAMELDKDLITSLIEKHGIENGFAVYKMYRDSDMEGLVRLKYSGLLKQGGSSYQYEPQSEISSKFLNDIA